MNPRMLHRYVALLGKLIVKYDTMSDILDFTDEELDLLRQAKTEYNFYHAHEIPEAGQEPNPSVDAVQKLGPRPTLGLTGRSTKTSS